MKNKTEKKEREVEREREKGKGELQDLAGSGYQGTAGRAEPGFTKS